MAVDVRHYSPNAHMMQHGFSDKVIIATATEMKMLGCKGFNRQQIDVRLNGKTSILMAHAMQ